MKVAIVHDWLVGGGAERVVEELHKLYPEAPIYTAYCSDEWRERLDGKVVTGWLQHFGKIRKFIPVLRIWYFTHLDFSGYDLVISSSGNGEAFGIRVKLNSSKWKMRNNLVNGKSLNENYPVHINYCHSPTHYYWRFYDQYIENPGFGMFNPFARLGLRLLVKPLRAWDYKAAQRPDYFIANSTHIQSEIKEFYGRDSTVIFPPVDTLRFSQSTASLPKARKGFVTAARQVPQKKLDIIIKAANKLNAPLTVIGRGPEHENLVNMAGKSIIFAENVSDAEIPIYFANAEAFVFASYEDFGVTPVEAMAAGTPVIAFEAGGALDYIKPGINGEFFKQQTVESLAEAMQEFNPKKYSEKAIQQSAEKFSTSAFQTSFKDFISSLTAMS
jgi:glycosyltransferase involved in cell wall biosynthesis